jgi:hypothetical protein
MSATIRFAPALVFLSAVLSGCGGGTRPEAPGAGVRGPVQVSDEKNALAAGLPGTWAFSQEHARALGLPAGPEGRRIFTFRADDASAARILEALRTSAPPEWGRAGGWSGPFPVYLAGELESVRGDGKRLDDFALGILHGLPALLLLDRKTGALAAWGVVLIPDGTEAGKGGLLFVEREDGKGFLPMRRLRGPGGAEAAAPAPGEEEDEGEEPALEPAVVRGEESGAASRESFAAQEKWAKAILQTENAAARFEALAEVQRALQSGDPALQRAALAALAQASDVNFDKAPFRPLVLPLLDSPAAPVRRAALYALYNTQPLEQDVPKIVQMANDASAQVRSCVGHILFLYKDGDLTGAEGDVVRRLLDDRDPEVAENTLNGLWGARVSRPIEEKILEWSESKDPEKAHDAIYFGLSTLHNKSEAVVRRLIRAMEGDDFENSGRARWGLGYGVPEEHHPLLADAFLRLLENRGDPSIGEECLRALETYASAAQLQELEAYADNPLAPEPLRQRARRIVERIRARK